MHEELAQDIEGYDLTTLIQYFETTLAKTYGEDCMFIYALPLDIQDTDEDGLMTSLRDQIRGYAALLRYLHLKNKQPARPMSQKKYCELELDGLLVEALEFRCPAAFSVLINEAIGIMNELSWEKIPHNHITSLNQAIEKAIKNFGALGHFLAARLNFTLGNIRYHFDTQPVSPVFKVNAKAAPISELYKSAPSKNPNTAISYYQQAYAKLCLTADALQKNPQQEKLFMNGHPGIGKDTPFMIYFGQANINDTKSYLARHIEMMIERQSSHFSYP